MQFIAYYFPRYRLLIELGIEPALLIGIDHWNNEAGTSVMPRCASLYFGPFVLSLHY